jgi:1-acyl-sn-glycerol-3-phosphate acyltransferase
MAPHHVARLRLLALCSAAGCQAAAYAAVTVQTVTQLQAGSLAAFRPNTLAAWLGLCAVPALLLTPVVGPVAGSRWNRAAVVGASALMAVVAGLGVGNPDVPILSVLGLLSVGLAIVGPGVVAALPIASRSARASSTTAGLAVVLAAAVGIGSFAMSRNVNPKDPLPSYLPPTLLGAAAILLWFARPLVAEPTPLTRGFVKPFVAGVRGALAHRRARPALVGLWLWSFVALSTAVVFLRSDSLLQLQHDRERATGLLIHGSPDYYHDFSVLRFVSALIAGILVTALNCHPYRHAGFVLYAALTALVALVWLRFGDSLAGPLILLGFAVGLALSPLLNFYFVWTTPRHHGVATALVVAGWCVGALVLAAILVNLGDDPAAARTALLNSLIAVSGIALIGGIGAFFRPAMELTAEAFFWPIYRIRGFGPGVEHLPVRGPYLVIGNHAGWFDPLFFAKILPAAITPMMISTFYDLPVISWLMRHVFGTIRVPDKTVRHEAPELKEAVAALDRGECVVLFPESYLRRKEEVPLRRFGRGIWQILHDRPQTPLFACWIEGAWGSFVSHRGGPPTKGKRPDVWRSIRIGVLGPIAVDPATLVDHMTTRTFLMQQVSEARRPLGLEPLTLPSVHEAEGEKE